MSEFLNWRTDPCLIDNEAIAENLWFTANKLIEQHTQTKIFLQPNILNLYSILVRKIDFQSGERLLQRLPYVTLQNLLADQLRIKSLALAEQCYYYFQNTAIDYSIKKWQRKIIDYTENQKRLPFALFRLSDSWQDFLTQEYVLFQSARGENFQMPTRLTNDLAYFLGIVIGDGHLNYHNIELVDFSQEHMLMLQKLAKKLFDIEGAISGEKKVWLMHLNNKWIVRLANFLTDQPITGKKYLALREPLVFVSNEKLRWEFWSGVLDADGSYTNGISFSSTSQKFVRTFGILLDHYKVKYSIYHQKSIYGESFVLYIKTISKDIINKFLHSRHPIKKKSLSQYLNRKKSPHLNLEFFNRQYIKRTNPQSLITVNDEIFFNFELLPELQVTNCANYLRKIRKTNQWTQQNLADFLGIAKGRLAAYEYSGNLPIAHLIKLVSLLHNVPCKLMTFLEQNGHNHFRSRKTMAKLELKPNDDLLQLLKFLAYCKEYLVILENNEKLFSKLKQRFEVKIVKTNKIQNSVLHQYLRAFFLLSSKND